MLGVLPPTIPFYRDRLAAPRQPVGDHGDAGDPRAGLRRGPRGGPGAARRDQPAAGGPLRPDPDDQPQGRGVLQQGARSPALPPGRRRGRAGGRGGRGPRVRAGPCRPRAPRSRVGRRGVVAQRPPGRSCRCLRPAPRRPRGQLPGRRDHPPAHRRGDRSGSPAAPHPAVPARRPGRQRGRADGRLRWPDVRTADGRAGRGSGPQLRRRLVVRRPAGVRAAGPGALGRGGGAGVVRPVGGAVLGPRGARPGTRLLRDRTAHRRAGLARRAGSRPAGPRPTTGPTSPGTPRCTS